MFEELAEYEAAIRADEREACAREVKAIDIETIYDPGGSRLDQILPPVAARLRGVVVPVSSVVPITRLREWIAGRATAGPAAPHLNDLIRFLDEFECASNPNNERTNDA